MQYKEIKLKDVADKLNLSYVTVSKGLRGNSEISEKTREMITRQAAEMGYIPNLLAQKLSSKRTNLIGLLVPKITDYFFPELVDEIYEAALEKGYEVILQVSRESYKNEIKQIQSLLSMGVDGILISISKETVDYSHFKKLLSKKIPIVFYDRIPELPNITSVTCQDRQGSFNAINRAINAGYKKFAFIGSAPRINNIINRYEGFKDALKQNGIQINSDWIVFGESNEELGYWTLMNFLQKNERPELIFTTNYPIALGVFNAALKNGLRIPADINIVSFGSSSGFNSVKPLLNYIEQSPKKIAKSAVDLLLEKIENPLELKNINVMIESMLMDTFGCLMGKMMNKSGQFESINKM